MIIVKYDSNNSGGSFWLKDEDWAKLEKAGWKVQWGKRILEKGQKRPETYEEAKQSGETWLGAIALEASKEFENIKDALIEFEKITGQTVTDEGCNCCGPPHNFTWSSLGCNESKCSCSGGHKDYNYGSGESLSEFLYDVEDSPKTLREALKKISELEKSK